MKQIALNLATSPSYAPEDFVVSGCNQLAWQWLEKWPDWPSYAAIIVGPEAAGKTHLLNCWRAISHAHAAYADGAMELTIRPLAIDDADGWLEDSAQTKLFHLLNQAKDSGHRLLLTASTPPSAWAMTLKDLRSRLLSLPVWEVEAPDEAVLAAVLAKHFTDRQLSVDPAVIRYIISRSERSFASIQHIAEQVDAYALEQQRPITTALVRSWMDTPS